MIVKIGTLLFAIENLTLSILSFMQMISILKIDKQINYLIILNCIAIIVLLYGLYNDEYGYLSILIFGILCLNLIKLMIQIKIPASNMPDAINKYIYTLKSNILNIIISGGSLFYYLYLT